MFVQIHMLQSMPPGNLNRDDTGQPKKCLFGGVTRGRISSQCLKRNIRRSAEFAQAFGDELACRTQYLPRMVINALKDQPELGIPEEEFHDLMGAIAGKFKKDKRATSPEENEDQEAEHVSAEGSPSTGLERDKTGQLVFFPPPYAHRVAELAANLRNRDKRAYDHFIGRRVKPKVTKEEKERIKGRIDEFIQQAYEASRSLTVDIALFGRMTTSDLIINVEATCQVAHAISTHETIIESDYFTAMDDQKEAFVSTQIGKAAASFLGSGEAETFFNSAVYYKYLNLDTDGLQDQDHLSVLTSGDGAKVAGVLLKAAALATPTGKQNSFAAHSVPELILVEVSKTKRPISYANAFLEPVEDRNLMTGSANALCAYIDTVATGFAPLDVHRVMLAVGSAVVDLKSAHDSVLTLDELVHHVVRVVAAPQKVEVA